MVAFAAMLVGAGLGHAVYANRQLDGCMDRLGMCVGRVADARRGLHMERLHGPPHRRRSRTHTVAAHSVRPGIYKRRFGVDRYSMPVVVGYFADLQSSGHRLGRVGVAASGRLPLRQALHMVAAGLFGAGLQLGGIAGMDCTHGITGRPAVVLYLAGIAWTLFYDTIYAHQDIEDDALIGVKSTARLFAEKTPDWLRRFLAATVGLMGIAAIFAALPNASPLAMALALAAPWAMGWHMAWQLRGLDIGDPAKCMQLFRANRDTGAIPLVFFLVALMV